VRLRPDKKDKKLVGHSAGLELYDALPFPVVDSVAHTILKGKCRGEHYHSKETGKIEVFAPLIGEAILEWHETGFPTTRTNSVIMKGIWPRLRLPDKEYVVRVYLVYPDTCHRVIARTDFLMISMNNVRFVAGSDSKPCEYWQNKKKPYVTRS
jgi:hypothetical protein